VIGLTVVVGVSILANDEPIRWLGGASIVDPSVVVDEFEAMPPTGVPGFSQDVIPHRSATRSRSGSRSPTTDPSR
jgi:hypothetical protein